MTINFKCEMQGIIQRYLVDTNEVIANVKK